STNATLRRLLTCDHWRDAFAPCCKVVGERAAYGSTARDRVFVPSMILSFGAIHRRPIAGGFTAGSFSSPGLTCFSASPFTPPANLSVLLPELGALRC